MRRDVAVAECPKSSPHDRVRRAVHLGGLAFVSNERKEVCPRRQVEESRFESAYNGLDLVKSDLGNIGGNLADGIAVLLCVVAKKNPVAAVSLLEGGHTAPLSGLGNVNSMRGQWC